MEAKLRLILFAPPDQAGQLRGKDCIPAPMAYRIGTGLTLQRFASLPDLRGGILGIAGGSTHPAGKGNIQLFCRQVQRECIQRGAMGFWLELDPRPDQDVKGLLSALDSMAQNARLGLWVPEWCGQYAPHGSVLVSSALSGGTLRSRLTDAQHTFGTERVTLAIEPMAEDFTLPSPNGRGRLLEPGELQRLMNTLHPNVFYSSELCAHYFTFLQKGVPHFVLFDNSGSIRKKYALAQQLGLSYVLAPWDAGL